MDPTAALAELLEGAGPFRDVAIDSLRLPLVELERRLAAAHGPTPIAEICADLFRSGGKRLRPLAALASAAALRLEPEPALVVAEVAELTHGAALLHDDVIDEADRRRGQVAARLRWSNTLSILSGDFLLVRSLRLVAGLATPALHDFYLRTLEDLLASEAQQHVAKRTGDLSVEGYLAIAEGKTGSLFGFACAAPALILGLPQEAERLDRFGRDMGVAFQVADDIRDLMDLDPTKTSSLDLVDGVASLPIRCAALADPGVAGFVAESRTRKPSADEVLQIAARARAPGALLQAVDIGRDHLQAALQALDAVPGNERFITHRAVCAWLAGELDLQAQAA